MAAEASLSLIQEDTIRGNRIGRNQEEVVRAEVWRDEEEGEVAAAMSAEAQKDRDVGTEDKVLAEAAAAEVARPVKTGPDAAAVDLEG